MNTLFRSGARIRKLCLFGLRTQGLREGSGVSGMESSSIDDGARCHSPGRQAATAFAPGEPVRPDEQLVEAIRCVLLGAERNGYDA